MATSLNALVLKIGADTSGVSDAVKLVRRDISNVNSAMRRAAGDAGKYQSATNSLETVMETGALTQEEYARAQKAINTQYGGGWREARKVNAAIAEGIPKTTRLAQNIRLLRRAYADGDITQDAYLRTNRRLRNEYSKLSASTDAVRGSTARARSGFDRMRNSQTQVTGSTGALIGRLKGLIAVYLSFNAIRGVFNFATELETNAVAFEVLTGSAEKGKQVYSDLQKLAASTPLTLPGVVDAEKTLLQFGVSLEKTIPLIKQIGDISGGNADRMRSLVLVMGQVSANARLNGQDLLQFINAGFNPLNEIAKKTGKSMGELRDEMSKGLITTAMVEDSLRTATSAGGLFFGMLDRTAGTTTGSLQLLATEVTTLAASFATTLLPAVAKGAQVLRQIVIAIKSFKDSMSTGTAKTLLFFGSFAAAALILPTVVGLIGVVVTAVRTWITAQVTLLALSGPKGWGQLAVGVAIAAGTTLALGSAFAAADEAVTKATAAVEADTAATKANAAAKNDLAAIAAKQAKRDEALASYTKEFRAIRDRNVALREGPVYAAEMLRLRIEQDRLNKGYTQAQVDKIALLEQEVKMRENSLAKEKEANKLADDKQQKIKNNLKSIGDSLRKSMETPYDALVNKLGEINAAAKAGTIGINTAAAARNKAMGEFKGSDKPQKVELPPSLTRGSREEYKLLADRMSGSRDREEARFREQLALQNVQADAARRTNEILEGQEQFDGVS